MKHYKKIEELVEGELEDYSYFKKWELHHEEDYDDYEFYKVDIWIRGDEEKEYPTKTLSFKIDDKDIYIELGEDSYQKICDFEYTIKYFWMALLNWDI